MRKALRSLWRIITAPFRFVVRLWRAIWGWFARKINGIGAFFTEEVEDAPVVDAIDKAFDNPTGLFEHLDALRKHLVRSVLVLALTSAAIFTFFDQIMTFLAAPLPGGITSLRAIEVTEPISTVFRVTLFGGFFLAFPYIAMELWLFIAPGIGRRARVYGLLVIPGATLLFVLGVAFTYYLFLPRALPFLLGFGGFVTDPRPSNYIKFIVSIMFWIGIAFEFPLLIVLLAKLGWIEARTLAKQWRIAIVIIAVVAAMVTPTVDPYSMGMVMLPMIVLYGISVLLAFLVQTKSPAPK